MPVAPKRRLTHALDRGAGRTRGGVLVIDKAGMVGTRDLAWLAEGRGPHLVFPTSSGSRRDKDNARERVVRPVVKRADELLAERGHEPLPAGVTVHELRHTSRRSCSSAARTRRPSWLSSGTRTRPSRFASMPTRCDATRATRSGSERSSRAAIGTIALIGPTSGPMTFPWKRSGTTKTPQMQGLHPMGAAGFRTSDLSRVKRDESGGGQPPEQGRLF